MDQCGLPKEMALELFKPFVMKDLVEMNAEVYYDDLGNCLLYTSMCVCSNFDPRMQHP